MTQQIFEYPLNTKVRSYLRLEHIHFQLERAITQDHGVGLFQPLFGLYEVCERIDYKNDFLKDLDKFLQLTYQWENKSNADLEKIHAHREKLQELKQASWNHSNL